MNAAAQLRTHLVTAATHLERAWGSNWGDVEDLEWVDEIERARCAIARALQVLASSESSTEQQSAPCDAGVDAGTRDF